MFVGRRKILNYLRKLADDVLGGEARFVHLRGSRGIGKTTLIRKFLNELPENFVGFKLSYELPFDTLVREFLSRFSSKRKLFMKD